MEGEGRRRSEEKEREGRGRRREGKGRRRLEVVRENFETYNSTITRGAQQSTYPVLDILTADHSCVLIQHAR